jgi:hypothetical protein
MTEDDNVLVVIKNSRRLNENTFSKSIYYKMYPFLAIKAIESYNVNIYF